SLSVLLDTGDTIVGDLISSGILLGGIARKDKAKRPPFEENPKAVATALRSLANSGGKLFFMGHGGPLPKEEVLRHCTILETHNQ
ncbi:MAG: hypothetical protein VW274_10785, partial [Thalassolituus sp.]